MISAANAAGDGAIQHTNRAYSIYLPRMLCASARRLHHRHNEGGNVTRQELAIKRGLSKEPPMQYYKYDAQSV
jgi:hypothetical protein